MNSDGYFLQTVIKCKMSVDNGNVISISLLAFRKVCNVSVRLVESTCAEVYLKWTDAGSLPGITNGTQCTHSILQKFTHQAGRIYQSRSVRPLYDSPASGNGKHAHVRSQILETQTSTEESR